MSRAANILIVDDDAKLATEHPFILEKGGMKSSMASSGEEAIQRCAPRVRSGCCSTCRCRAWAGSKALRIMRERHPDVGVIMCSVLKDIAVAVEAMHAGALDYITRTSRPRS